MKLLLALCLLIPQFALAQRPISFSGRVTDINSVAIQNPNTVFNVKISNASTCVLYNENFATDMSDTNGYFKVVLGSGTSVFSPNSTDIFRSASYLCEDGASWSASASDLRKVSVSVKVGDEPWVNFSSDTMNGVAYANESEYLRGKSATDFVQTSSITTQAKIDTLAAQTSNILDLINGTNNTYAKQSLVDTALSGKQNSLTYSPINPANNLSELTSPSTARTNLGLGSLAIRNTITDLDISSVAWSKLSGAPASFPPSAHVHAQTDVTGLISALNSKIDKVSQVCSDTQVASYNSITDSFSCADIQTGGDLTGKLSVAVVNKIQGRQVSPAAPNDGDILKYNSSNARWEPTSLSSSGVAKAYAGEIITFPGTCPTGTALADGSTKLRADAPDLFAAYQCAFSCPTTVTFNLPDYRGYFLRSADNGAGIDSGRLVNTTQTDMNKSHTHIQDAHSHGYYDKRSDGPPGPYGYTPKNHDVGSFQEGTFYTYGATATNQYDGGPEARPKNKSVNYCIRLQNMY